MKTVCRRYNDLHALRARITKWNTLARNNDEWRRCFCTPEQLYDTLRLTGRQVYTGNSFRARSQCTHSAGSSLLCPGPCSLARHQKPVPQATLGTITGINQNALNFAAEQAGWILPPPPLPITTPQDISDTAKVCFQASEWSACNRNNQRRNPRITKLPSLWKRHKPTIVDATSAFTGPENSIPEVGTNGKNHIES